MKQTSLPNPLWDIAIIGGGVSGTYTLTLLLEEIGSKSEQSGPIRIAFIDRYGELGTGIPYGKHSALNNLIITNLDEFVPDDDRKAFTDWLAATRPEWKSTLLADAGSAAAKWVEDNASEIEADQFHILYVPRRLFGDYLSQSARGAIRAASLAGNATVDEMPDEAIGIEPAENGYRIQLASGATISAAQVVVAIGSPPNRSISDRVATGQPGTGFIEDQYQPSFDATMETICDRLEAARPGRRNVLIVGTNASSLELVYALAHDARARTLTETVVTLSPSGEFPHPISKDGPIEADFPGMTALLDQAGCGADQIIETAEADVAAAVARGVKVGDSFHRLGQLLIAVLGKQDRAVVEAFHRDHGMRFSRLIRRAGYDYSTTAAAMRQAGRLRLVKGLAETFAVDEAGISVGYADRPGEPPRFDPARFAAVVNCGGFEPLSDASTSPLIRQLVASGLGRPNATGRGFAVDEGLRMAPGVFVIGPLLGGVFNKRFQLWHVENVRRIRSLAPVVVAGLSEGIARTTPMPADANAGEPN